MSNPCLSVRRSLCCLAPLALVLMLVPGMSGFARAHQAQPHADRAQVPDHTRLPARALSAAGAPLSYRDGQAMIAISAGQYPIGNDDGPADQRPAHTVTLSAFQIDRHEVRNGAFAEFLNALGLTLAGPVAPGRADRLTGTDLDLLREGPYGDTRFYPLIALNDENARIDYRDGRFVPQAGFADRPVAETTWAGAAAYCAWRGARLPTEAEWEAAARGPDGRLYPWGDEPPDATRAYVNADADVLAPVGSLPAGASPFGVLDMAGSLAEWTSTLKQPYPYAPHDGREDPGKPGERVTRGGDYQYDNDAQTLRATHRNGFSNEPSQGHRQIGVRCAS